MTGINRKNLRGGTGHLGKGIARRLAQGGHQVTIGSRAADKAEAIAVEMQAQLGLSLAFGANTDVAQGKDVVIVTVPCENQERRASRSPRMSATPSSSIPPCR